MEPLEHAKGHCILHPPHTHAPCCFHLMRSIIYTIIEFLSKEKRRMMVDHMSLDKKSLFEMDHDGQMHNYQDPCYNRTIWRKD
jgi:hypothetical protein